ncbi:aconitate hydratase AcnA [Desulfatirhabdium butyrativorans]|uniref:aconitate hydratase AcnA n=1 Tax=Desulfatirhabdium butyrativorans TaxID=340467 RepID=UPI0003F92375|nr:aconitate hydratase AcnA [Desulfatirhabdium butyrativorans]
MTKPSANSFNVLKSFPCEDREYLYFSLPEVAVRLGMDIETMPFCLRILLENLLRNEDGTIITSNDIRRFCQWSPSQPPFEIPFFPSRVLLQDFTGVPAIVDMAGMRDAAKDLFDDPQRINPIIPAELIIDHSVQIDAFGGPEAFRQNAILEFQRNAERYTFLKWGQNQFRNFTVIPPATGICHQVNLEYLARVVFTKSLAGRTISYPDTVVGLDSHTTMVNGLGVLGWGVGGIEAEAVMLGSPYYLLTPKVVGLRLTGRLPSGVTATDLVLTITQLLRQTGVVGQFVEFFGPGLEGLRVEDRATIANMAPEYGATAGFFPVDQKTIDYLRLTHRDAHTLKLVECYCRQQGLFRDIGSREPLFSRTVELDLSTVLPCVAGPKRPQERIPLTELKHRINSTLDGACPLPSPATEHILTQSHWEQEGGRPIPKNIDSEKLRICEAKEISGIPVVHEGSAFHLNHGSVVIAAITSCTNTSNPSTLIAAGLLARNAVQAGLSVKPWVKTSFAPGSRVATDYLRNAGLLPYLEKLGFYVAAYGCTTCIGNSGPLPDAIAKAIEKHEIVVASVLSGNRNFEGRIHPLTKANFLASPPLVIAFALAGTIRIDLLNEPIGINPQGKPIFLKDIWPEDEQIESIVQQSIHPDLYAQAYRLVFDGSEEWQNLVVPSDERYAWDTSSTYIQKPPFFRSSSHENQIPGDIADARVIAFLGDGITTDHISPAGAIPVDSPAGQFLLSKNISPESFNSYGSRRGNHDVMVRGTFANIRLQNKLVPGIQGGYTRFLPTGEVTSIYDASIRYASVGTPLIVLAGKEYGTGSSRDWAAKGTLLLGIKAVIAESFERIHRSNLVCMGVLPLEFLPGQNAATLGLDGTETFSLQGIGSKLSVGKGIQVVATSGQGKTHSFSVKARLDSPIEVAYYQYGGILPYVLRLMGDIRSV